LPISLASGNSAVCLLLLVAIADITASTVAPSLPSTLERAKKLSNLFSSKVKILFLLT
jgi:hypothetical protein